MGVKPQVAEGMTHPRTGRKLMKQVPGSWMSDDMMDRLIRDLARVPLVRVHQINSYVKAYPYLGSKKSPHSRSRALNKSWPLTTQQQTYFQMLAEGKTLKEIAYLKEKTAFSVGEAMARARARAGCDTNLELMAKAVAAGIVGVREPLNTEYTPQRLVVRIAGRTFASEEEKRATADTVEKEIGARLKKAREAASMTTDEARAQLSMEMSRRRLLQIEEGYSLPTLRQAVELATIYGTHLGAMLPMTEGLRRTNGKDPRAFVRHLSEAELEVLRLMAQGHSYGSAAEERGNTVETVKTHMRSIRMKLGAKTTAQAVALAYRNGALS